MALIKCPECGHSLSTWARECPECGIPQEVIQKLLAEQEADQKSSLSVINSGTEEEPAPQTTEKPKDIFLNSHVKIKKTIRCGICNTSYQTNRSKKCPQCGYPILSFASETPKAQEEIKKCRASGITMGRYMGSPISWRILSVEDEKILLISEKVLDFKPYNKEKREISWKTCTLRKWLNTEFLENTFRADEKAKIAFTKISDKPFLTFTIDQEYDTNDQIFLLSFEEAKSYFDYDQDRQGCPTEYAQSKDIIRTKSDLSSIWWLRTSDYSTDFGPYVWIDGRLSHIGYSVDTSFVGIRPAMWIYLNGAEKKAKKRSSSKKSRGR